jgi:hypothetical protein
VGAKAAMDEISNAYKTDLDAKPSSINHKIKYYKSSIAKIY